MAYAIEYHYLEWAEYPNWLGWMLHLEEIKGWLFGAKFWMMLHYITG